MLLGQPAAHAGLGASYPSAALLPRTPWQPRTPKPQTQMAIDQENVELNMKWKKKIWLKFAVLA